MGKRHLEYRVNNAWDTVLLVERGRVIASWMVDSQVSADYRDYRDKPDEWPTDYDVPTEEQDPDAWGERIDDLYDGQLAERLAFNLGESGE